MTLRRLHRTNAALLGIFIALHLTNHLALLFGRTAHDTVMETLRPLYRNLVSEPVLLALFAAQIVLGLALAIRRGWPRDHWGRAQILSGGLLAAFVMAHVPAVLLARATTDTDTGFAAAVVTSAPQMWFYIPYYIAAVTALTTHLAAALRFAQWPSAPGTLPRVLPWLGLVLGIVIVAGLKGAFDPV